ncbi:hypothetical protein L798_08572 [Zootermopsis nevadensis]|uniref:Uncharacterized protein n=1 Tax=Zootermopsis nevadensis TaxID=136037 RepID=A0A067RET6_ZOONE|nr:hypothetical protein L798_08572 [Zootermopsis nevadensis]
MSTRVEEDFAPEIRKCRRELIAYLRDVKRGRRAFLKKDKLVVDGRISTTWNTCRGMCNWKRETRDWTGCGQKVGEHRGNYSSESREHWTGCTSDALPRTTRNDFRYVFLLAL